MADEHNMKGNRREIYGGDKQSSGSMRKAKKHEGHLFSALNPHSFHCVGCRTDFPPNPKYARSTHRVHTHLEVKNFRNCLTSFSSRACSWPSPTPSRYTTTLWGSCFSFATQEFRAAEWEWEKVREHTATRKASFCYSNTF